MKKMRHLLEKVNNITVCYPNEELLVFGFDLLVRYNIIIMIVIINLLIVLWVLYFIKKMIYKKVITYTQDEYKTTVNINHVV